MTCENTQPFLSPILRDKKNATIFYMQSGDSYRAEDVLALIDISQALPKQALEEHVQFYPVAGNPLPPFSVKDLVKSITKPKADDTAGDSTAIFDALLKLAKVPVEEERTKEHKSEWAELTQPVIELLSKQHRYDQRKWVYPTPPTQQSG